MSAYVIITTSSCKSVPSRESKFSPPAPHKHVHAHINTAQSVQYFFLWNDERKRSRVVVVRMMVKSIHRLSLRGPVIVIPVELALGRTSWSSLTTPGHLCFAVRHASSLASLVPHITANHHNTTGLCSGAHSTASKLSV